MRKKKVVLFYQDTKYILPIVAKLIEMYDEHCDFSLFSDPDFFEKEIGEDHEIDVLIADKDTFSEDLLKHKIPNILLFTDDDGDLENTTKLNVQLVYKYLSVKEIINEIGSCSILKSIEEADGIVTDTIVVYSPIGGAGTTTLALGLSQVLTNKHKKVLYMNVGQLQNHAFRFKDKTSLDDLKVKKFKETDNDFYENIKKVIREEGFSYLPPFPRCLASLDLQDRHMVQAINKIKETCIYDHIVIDTCSELNECNSELMAQAENVLIVGKPDEESLYKLKIFLRAIDCTDKNKFRFVCNFADENSDKMEAPFATDYVMTDPTFAGKSIEDLGRVSDIERLGIRYI